jgi:hypothetical protein
MSEAGKRAKRTTGAKQTTKSKGGAKRRKKSTKPLKRISAQLREQMISESAYFKAEDRGFSGGDPEQDWLLAEAEIDAALLGSKAPKS